MRARTTENKCVYKSVMSITFHFSFVGFLFVPGPRMNGMKEIVFTHFSAFSSSPCPALAVSPALRAAHSWRAKRVGGAQIIH